MILDIGSNFKQLKTLKAIALISKPIFGILEFHTFHSFLSPWFYMLNKLKNRYCLQRHLSLLCVAKTGNHSIKTPVIIHKSPAVIFNVCNRL